MTERLEAIVEVAAHARQQAHKELSAGQKRGHWIWWVFPTLAERGGDQFSAMQHPDADLHGAEHVEAYAKHPVLRVQLLESFRTATAAFAKVTGGQAPWKVLDSGFRRTADGVWVKGPVDSCACQGFQEPAQHL